MGFRSRNEIAVSGVCVFRFSGHYQAFFQSGFRNLSSYWQCEKFAAAVHHPCLYLILSVHVVAFVMLSHCDFKLHFHEK